MNVTLDVPEMENPRVPPPETLYIPVPESEFQLYVGALADPLAACHIFPATIAPVPFGVMYRLTLLDPTPSSEYMFASPPPTYTLFVPLPATTKVALTLVAELETRFLKSITVVP